MAGDLSYDVLQKDRGSPSSWTIHPTIGVSMPSMTSYLDICPLQRIIQKKESPDVHSLGLDVLVIPLKRKIISLHC